MIIEYNFESQKKTLMIHSFQSGINGIPGDTTSEFILDLIIDQTKSQFTKEFMEFINEFEYITFDDGLYQQIELIKLFPKERVIFFPSFGLLRPKELQPTPIENSIAHDDIAKGNNPNEKTSLSTFMTSTEAWDLMQSGYTLGMHGWNHLNLNLKPNDIDIDSGKWIKLLNDDAKKCANAYIDYFNKLDEYPIKGGYFEIYFCTPYNCMNELQHLYISLLANHLEKLAINIPKKLIIFSYERTPIENFLRKNTCHYVIKLD